MNLITFDIASSEKSETGIPVIVVIISLIDSLVIFFFVLLFMPLFWHTNNIGYGNGAYENVSHGNVEDHHDHGGGH